MTILTEPVMLELRPTNVPAKKIPAGLWIDVLAVLKAHGLEPSPTEVTAALSRIVRHTPVDQGGRLRPDGSIDQSDYPDMEPSWFCSSCWTDMYSEDSKARHDEWCHQETQPAP